MAKKNRRFKWVGVQKLAQVNTFPSTSVSSVHVISAPIVDGDIQADSMVERVLCSLNIQRISTTTIEGLGYIVAKQKFDSTGTLIQVLDPLSTDVFDLGNKDIMAMGRLPIIGNIPIGNAAGVQLSKDLLVHEIDVRVRRKLDRLTEGVTLTIVGDVSAIVKVSSQCRALLSFV